MFACLIWHLFVMCFKWVHAYVRVCTIILICNVLQLDKGCKCCIRTLKGITFIPWQYMLLHFMFSGIPNILSFVWKTPLDSPLESHFPVSLFRSILKWRSTPFPLPLLPPKTSDLLQIQLLQRSYPVKGRSCILLLAALSVNLLWPLLISPDTLTARLDYLCMAGIWCLMTVTVYQLACS